MSIFQHILKLSDCDLLDPDGSLSSKMPYLAVQANNYNSLVIRSQLFAINRVSQI